MAFDGFQIAADFLRWQMSTLPCQIQQGCCELNIVKLMIRDKLDCRYSDLTGARPDTQPSQRWECVCVAESELDPSAQAVSNDIPLSVPGLRLQVSRMYFRRSFQSSEWPLLRRRLYANE